MNQLTFEEAVNLLQNLQILIYPTETFYAIGGSALNVESVAAIYSAKERDKILPLPVIIGDLSQLEMVAANICQDAETLIGKFWPGPLTIIMPARPDLPNLLTAGTGRVAVRLSSHFEATSLALAAGFPLISSSANLSGREPVTNVQDLDPALLQAAKGMVFAEGDQPRGGYPSTIVELVNMPGSGTMLHVLREGVIPVSSFIQLGFACYIK